MDASEDSYAWSLRSQLSSLLLVFCICPAGSLHLSLPAFCILSGSSSWGSGLSYVLCTWSAELMRKWWSRQGAPRCTIYVHYTMYNVRYKINIIQRMVYLQWWYNYGWTLQKLFAYDMEELPQLNPKEFDLFGKLCISWRGVGKDVMSRQNYDDDGCFDESILWSRRLRWHKSMHMGTPRHCTDEKTSSKCPTTITICPVQCAYVLMQSGDETSWRGTRGTQLLARVARSCLWFDLVLLWMLRESILK